MEVNRLPLFGANEGTYVTLKPPDHTGVCWAAAIGAAMRPPGSRHGEETALRAVDMLADGTAQCICRPARAKRRGRGR
ncbi:MAG: hypothetical protein WKF57_03775 [Nakamurella sp.]